MSSDAATCLTCGAAILDPTAGACHECGAEDNWIGSQWVKPGFPRDVTPFDLIAATTAPAETAQPDRLRAVSVRLQEHIAARPFAGTPHSLTDECWGDWNRTVAAILRASEAKP